MEDMKYYRQLIQQGYPPMAAAQYTKQYFPEFQEPILNPSLFISPDANSILQPSVQNLIGLSTNGLESSLGSKLDGKGSRKKIFIASILILGLVGTGGYFLNDSMTDDYEEYGCVGPYSFEDGDAAGVMSNATGDALVRIQMSGGCKELNWALLEISIVVDGGPSYLCYADDSTAECTYSTDEDKYWNKRESIIISEGDSLDLCDSNCKVEVTIIKLGVGEINDKIVGNESTTAENRN
tara:strand:+ start:136 stop:849 length:714 start_codon:yes stop_codon:yes gene_type:complete